MSKSNKSLFFKAIEENDLNQVKEHLNGGISINVRENETGRTALHYAILHDNTDLFNYLLEQNPDIDILDSSGLSPLEFALQKKKYTIARELMHKGSRYTDMVKYSVKSSKKIDPSIRKLLLEEDRIKSNESLFFEAIKANDINQVKELLNKGVSVNTSEFSTGRVALHYSILQHNKDIFDYLIEQKDVNIDIEDDADEPPLAIALVNEEYIMASVLVQKGSRYATLLKNSVIINGGMSSLQLKMIFGDD